MIEERARVVHSQGAYAWVETQRRMACGACNARCGTAALAKVLGRRSTRLQVLADVPVQAGDEVIIGIAENALIRGSLAVYMVPLLLMFLGAMMADLGGAGEGLSVLAGALGLGAGFAWLRTGAENDPRYQPVVLRRLDPPPPQDVLSP